MAGNLKLQWPNYQFPAILSLLASHTSSFLLSLCLCFIFLLSDELAVMHTVQAADSHRRKRLLVLQDAHCRHQHRQTETGIIVARLIAHGSTPMYRFLACEFDGRMHLRSVPHVFAEVPED